VYIRNPVSLLLKNMAGIYIHIPFCKQACYYCDFHFSTNLSASKEMFASLGREIEMRKDYIDNPVATIYLGGGTPSLAETADLALLIEKIRASFDLTHDVEITIEANPDDLSKPKLESLKAIGVNRLSIGIQSFDDTVLRMLNRAHDSSMATAAISSARKAGFDNISIDLIYSIPSQAPAQWEQNIIRALDLAPEHISAYSLTIEEKTVFGRWRAKGKIVPVAEDVSAEEFDILLSLLEKAGYEHYEISNFARPGCYSRHNSSYWKREKYLGIGPSAHSFNGSSRQFNISNNYEYIRAIARGETPASVEILSDEDQINDFLLTTLRTSWGTDLEKLRNELKYDLMNMRQNYIHTLIQNRLAVVRNDHLILTREGKFVADKISSDLFVPSRS
jgi:oxygen-independent coproporphyrinogen III oxidase